ncbi:pentatricopeptide repeat-containing protein At1g32415, mitochondrial [Gastrolobium bilobum]|uniref:pentatricopeptide repeat-containing protein At1g32415, mitochondrial n=1 Tax=Gastrolobium bilobum TaxID=150636 RepID=UPI002AAF71ED|nr:pentatricopeptide repeat-containing protein At1g32415, mitochondrial [Gastrolobium bilobum]
MRASTLSLRRFPLSSSSSSSSNLGYRYRYRTNHSEPLKAPLPFLRKSYCDDSLLLHYLSSGWHHEARNLLQKCSGRDLHARVVRWTSLLTNFCKKGYVDEARMLFDIMPHRNIVTCNAMLSGYLQSGMLSEACRFFENMPERNVVSWTAMLCGFADVGRIEDARKLFDVMPDKNVVSWNSMVAGFIRNGDLEGAKMVFEQTPNKNVVSWNAMIAGYAESGRMDEAKALFDQMDQCKNVITWTSMISGYCRAGNVDEGYCLFRTMPEKNVVSWTAMIGGFAWNGLYEEALMLFLHMRLSDAKPNGETFISLAYACAGLCFPCLGKQLHAQLIVNSWKLDDYDGRLRRSLVRMYSVFGLMDSAHNVFEGDLKNCDDQSFNSMINGYIQAGQLEKAQELFDMVPIRNRIAWTCMIAGYLSAGQVLRACNLFNNMPDRDSIAWTSMIYGYVQNELIAEAISLFAEMMADGVSPINSTYAVVFGAMGSVAYLDLGRQLHGMQLKTIHEYDLILENSLISMYAKCGEIDDAYRIFSNMTYRDKISWNSMIMGLSDNGRANEAIKVFETMLESGIYPNTVTFLGILTACAHAGLVDKGWELFIAMVNVYALQPGLEHYISIINLLGRAGRVKDAEEFVLRLPVEPNYAIWGALVGICGLSKTDADVARRAAKRLLELDPLNAPGYVALCNIYAANNRHIEETSLRKEMRVKGVRKAPGCSWILVKGRVHVFSSGDRLVPQVEDMLLQISGRK